MKCHNALVTIGVLLAVTSAVTMGSCRSADFGRRSTTGSLRTIDELSNGTSVIVRESDELELSLPENPTTGYGWNLQSSGEPVCQLVNTAFHSPSERIGQGGQRRWLFRVVSSGVADIKLSYRRPFERNTSPANVFKVRIQAGE
jgi:inhibitor of cysteine peptidase